MTHHLRERIRFETLSAIERVPVLAAPLLLPSTRSRRPAASALSATSLARHTHAGAMAGAPKSIARAAPVTAFASATPGAASRATPLVNTRLHDCPIRGDTLVWLKSAAPRALAETAANVAVAAGASVTAVPANTARPAAITSAAQMQAEVQKFARDAQRAFLLDPTLSERLADDVLRRVDKRLRIERERRGL
ncbi:MAG TPA: hypothetical protein VGQ22_23720 [Steroidobacteraceae bacterium]|nr:hypothetical protein [Steroidobacteraceae bacterium]